MIASLTAALLGVLLGLRHAFEPDHLAALSTLAAEERSRRGGLVLGAVWGAGHCGALLLVGGSLALLEAQMPGGVADGIELGVGVMICALGVRAIRRAVVEGRAGAQAPHRHGGLLHAHPAAAPHVHLSRWSLATRPLLVGLVHGLAGSGALTALVLAELPTAAARLSYLALFGAGSVLGMTLLTAVCGLPLARLRSAPKLLASFLLVAGLVSLGTGAWWGLCAAERLLR